MSRTIFCAEGWSILIELGIGSIYDNGRYARCYYKGKEPLVHNLLWQHRHGKKPKGYDVDHINRNKYDNRFENLRLVTRSKNKLNQEKVKGNFTTKFKGVHYCKRDKKFTARISLEGKRYYLLYSDSAIECAKAYDAFCESNNMDVATNKTLGLYEQSSNESTTS